MKVEEMKDLISSWTASQKEEYLLGLLCELKVECDEDSKEEMVKHLDDNKSCIESCLEDDAELEDGDDGGID